MPTRSLRSSVLKWPDRETVHASLAEWSAALAEDRPVVNRVGYLGSYARGEWGVGSDLDVVIVVACSSLPFADRPTEWDTLALPVPVDLRVYTEAELSGLAAVSPRMAKTLERETVWVYAQRR